MVNSKNEKRYQRIRFERLLNFSTREQYFEKEFVLEEMS